MMTKNNFLAAFCVVFLAIPLAGQAQSAIVSSEGVAYSKVVNRHGMVLTSKEPVFRIIVGQDGQKIVDEIETLYLGKDCDAFSEVLGDGRWQVRNGELTALFKTDWDQEFVFVFSDAKLPPVAANCT